jgi:hypothetical protein
MVTAFRNRWSGTDTTTNGGAANTQTIVVNIYSFSRYFNLIGNVLGTNGYHNKYETNIGNFNQTACETSIYSLGIGGSCYNQSPVANDPLVASTLFRWGNYDTVTGTIRFQASEVPSALSLYANAVPASTNLPASFYAAAKPAWFGSVPWPASGPDVSGGTGPGGHAYDIPAANCYLKTMGGKTDGTSGTLTFSAATCYAGVAQSGPAPASSLKAAVK